MKGFLLFLGVVVLLFVGLGVGAQPGAFTGLGPLLLLAVVALILFVFKAALRRLVIGLVIVALLVSMIASAVNTQIQEAKGKISSATSVPGAMLESVKETLFGQGVSPEKNPLAGWAGSFGKGYRRFDGTPFVQGTSDRCCIDGNDINQGYVGDCWVLASLGALAVTHPAVIANAIRDNGDGTYDVTLYRKVPGGNPPFTPEITRVDNAFPAWRFPLNFLNKEKGGPIYARFGDTSANGTPELWAMIIEKAFAQRDQGYSTIHGGHGYDALEVMTGQQSTRVNPAGMTRTQLAGLLGSLKSYRYAVTGGTRDQNQMANVPDIAPLFAGDDSLLVHDHEYFVRAYDAKKETVILSNPHGAAAKPHPQTLILTLDQLQRAFSVMSYNRPMGVSGGCQCS